MSRTWLGSVEAPSGKFSFVARGARVRARPSLSAASHWCAPALCKPLQLLTGPRQRRACPSPASARQGAVHAQEAAHKTRVQTLLAQGADHPGRTNGAMHSMSPTPPRPPSPGIMCTSPCAHYGLSRERGGGGPTWRGGQACRERPWSSPRGTATRSVRRRRRRLGQLPTHGLERGARVSEEHQGVLLDEDRVVDARVARPHRALEDNDLLGLPDA